MSAREAPEIYFSVFYDPDKARSRSNHDDHADALLNERIANDLISSYLSAECSTDEDFRCRVEKLRVMDKEG